MLKMLLLAHRCPLCRTAVIAPLPVSYPPQSPMFPALYLRRHLPTPSPSSPMSPSPSSSASGYESTEPESAPAWHYAILRAPGFPSPQSHRRAPGLDLPATSTRRMTSSQPQPESPSPEPWYPRADEAEFEAPTHTPSSPPSPTIYDPVYGDWGFFQV